MPLQHHPLTKEFPDLHDKIHELKMNDRHFHRLMDEYEALDKEIYRAESDEEPTDDTHLKEMRVHRVQLKDTLYGMLSNLKD